jgi:hypothetical protein
MITISSAVMKIDFIHRVDPAGHQFQQILIHPSPAGHPMTAMFMSGIRLAPRAESETSTSDLRFEQLQRKIQWQDGVDGRQLRAVFILDRFIYDEISSYRSSIVV